MTEWLSSDLVAALYLLTERAIRKKAERGEFGALNEGYRFVQGRGRGGKVLQINLNYLPVSIKARYKGEQDKLNEDTLLSLTDAQREVVFMKLAAVEGYLDFKMAYPKADKLKAYLAWYREQNPDKPPLTTNKLEHWAALYKRDGISGLVDRRGAWNKGTSSIPKEVRGVFLAYWLQEKGTNRGGPSVASCYRLTKLRFPDLQLPSVKTFERMARSIPYPAQVLGREGKKSYKDKCEPYIPRNYESMHTNQRWVADNHVFDVQVRFPDGHVGRPWVVGWQDMRSRYIVGFHIVLGDVNANDILEAFSDAVGNYGIPEGVILDNGADYTVHDLFNRENAYSLANEMLIAVTNAIPYNAKAKLIERFFNTLEYSYLIHIPSYIGANPKRRPEKMQTVNDKLKEIAIPYDEFVSVLEYVIDQYNNAPHSGYGMNGRTPFQAFEEEVTIPIKTASPELLSIYCQRRTKPLTVGRNGIRIAEFGQYYNDSLLFPYLSKKVYAKYRTSDVRRVYCFTEDGKYICTASSVEMGEMNEEITAQLMRKLNKEKQKRRKMMKEYFPDISVPSMQELAMKAGKSFKRPNLKVLPTMAAVDPQKQRQAEEIKREEAVREQEKQPAGKLKAVAGGLDPSEINRKLSERMKKIGG